MSSEILLYQEQLDIGNLEDYGAQESVLSDKQKNLLEQEKRIKEDIKQKCKFLPIEYLLKLQKYADSLVEEARANSALKGSSEKRMGEQALEPLDSNQLPTLKQKESEIKEFQTPNSEKEHKKQGPEAEFTASSLKNEPETKKSDDKSRDPPIYEDIDNVKKQTCENLESSKTKMIAASDDFLKQVALMTPIFASRAESSSENIFTNNI